MRLFPTDLHTIQFPALCRHFNQHSLEQQIDSLRALKPLDFLHVLPGHGRPMSFKDQATKDAYIDLTAAAETQEGLESGAAHSMFAESEAANPFLYRSVYAESSKDGAQV